MKSLLGFGVLFIAMSFCGLGDRMKQITDSQKPAVNTSVPSTDATGKPGTEASIEQAKMTPAQQAIFDAAEEVSWDEQGITWRLPKGWTKMDVKKETFNYKAKDNAFLLVNISSMPDDFPMDVSLKAYYQQALQQLKNGKYESARMLELDGVQGVEFTEAAPEEKDGIRRHQWIGYRNYLGQQQMVNMMVTTSADKFAVHSDDFPAVLYSIHFTK